MNPQYAEVHRILGQTESDRQLAILNKALQTYLPGIKNDRELGNAALLWDRRDKTWTKHLEEKHRKRKQPLPWNVNGSEECNRPMHKTE